MVLLTSRPVSSAKITYSMPKSTNRPLPASARAAQASAKITGKPTARASALVPMSAAPRSETSSHAAPIHNALARFGQAKTVSAVAPAWPRISPASVPAMVLRPLALARSPAAFSIAFLECAAQVRAFRHAIQRLDPAGRARRDLGVARPAEARSHLAEVDGPGAEEEDGGGDDQEAEVDCHPVFSAPGARWCGRLCS